MSARRIDHSPDLTRLRDGGYEIAIRKNFLVLSHGPYVTPDKTVAYGNIISPLTIVGQGTGVPENHVVYFQGDYFPCDENGNDLRSAIWNSDRVTIAEGFVVDFAFSAKPREPYTTYYDKMTAYVEMLGKYARLVNPDATATTYRVSRSDEEEEDPIFLYPETSSTRAGIAAISTKLALHKVAIVGTGGTGAYILDFVAKTHVGEIHLYDADVLANHNAFRMPGAVSRDELFTVPVLRKVEYLARKYGSMRRGVVAHPVFVDASNAAELVDADFVFLSLDPSEAKRAIVGTLIDAGRPFIDVGMGVDHNDDSVAGQLRITLSTNEKRQHRAAVSLAANAEDDYRNVQIAELNALNAAMAVIKWKKHFGFYGDAADEYSSIYTTEMNDLMNADFREPT